MNDTPTNSQSFRPVLALAEFLSGCRELWYVAGGWAIDLYLQQCRRKHKDVDIAVFRQDQLVIQKYFLTKGWKLWKYVGDSEVLEPWSPDERLELPDRGALAEPVDIELGNIDILLSEKKVTSGITIEMHGSRILQKQWEYGQIWISHS